MWEAWVQSLGWEDSLEKHLPTVAAPKYPPSMQLWASSWALKETEALTSLHPTTPNPRSDKVLG